MTALAGPHAYTRLSDRVAVLHALRVIGAARAGMIAGAPRGRDWESALSAMGFLVVASVAAVCSSLNERALREGRANLHSLVELAEELERTRDGDELTRQLARHVAEVGF